MKRCLYCGKEISPNATEHELNSLWHEKCSNSFFGTKYVPTIDISDEALGSLVIGTVREGLTVPGIQKKMSLHLSKERKEHPRLTVVNYPSGYILKPQTEEYEKLPELEHLVMTMANAIGIKTVPFALINNGERFAYITKRVDRITSSKSKNTQMLAMEDFCQLDGKLTMNKYRGSYERCSKIIEKYSTRSGLDQTELFIRIVFSLIVGNSDMHLKNFSLIETYENSKEYVLSDAYDLLPVNIIISQDKEQLALTLNDKKEKITRNDLIRFAESCNISKKTAQKLIDRILSKKELLLDLCEHSYISSDQKTLLSTLITQRISSIEKNSDIS